MTPIFLAGHIELWYDSWRLSWWSLSQALADAMTVIVIFCLILLVIRRIVQPYVRFLTGKGDYLTIALVSAPFITGFLAHYELLLDYKLMLTIHMITGEIMLIAIPFTRLTHMFLFWLTRSHTGSEFGAVRHSKDY